MLSTVISLSMVFIFLLIIIGSGFFFYSLVANKNNMNTEIKTKALDAFFYLGITISLIWSVVNLLQIIFSAVNRKFVDVLNANTYVDATSSDIRFAIAALIVMYPIYVVLSWLVSKDIVKFPYKRDLLVRKIMIYFTLFVTVCTLAGTLMTLIYTYLGGELSIRFELKALAVFVVSLALFAYYMYTMKRDYTKKSAVPVTVGIIATVVIIASLVWSVRIIGTPSEMRAKRLDSQRLSDISRIQQEVLNKVNMTDKMPATLAELENAFQGYAVPTDPITKVAYGYNVVQQPTFSAVGVNGKKTLVKPAIFELCATFETVRNVDARGMNTAVAYPTKVGMGGVGLSSEDMMYSAQNYYYEGDQSLFWNHDKGEKCFKRIITSEMYYGK